MKIASANQNKDNRGKSIKVKRGKQTLIFKTPVLPERDTIVTGLRSCKVLGGRIAFIDVDIEFEDGEREARSRDDIIVTPFNKFDLMAAYDITEKRAEKLANWMDEAFMVE